MRYYILFIMAFAAASAGFAQSVERQVMASAGTSVSSGNIQMDYTIGEMLTLSGSSATVSLSQGFNQPGGNDVSVKSIYATDAVTLYPNPTDGIINLEAKNLQADAAVMVYDATGKAVYSQVWHTTDPGLIDASSWESGCYTIRMQAGSQLLVYRLTKM